MFDLKPSNVPFKKQRLRKESVGSACDQRGIDGTDPNAPQRLARRVQWRTKANDGL